MSDITPNTNIGALPPAPATPPPVPDAHSGHGGDLTSEQLSKALKGRTPIWKPVVALALLAVGVGGLVALGAVPRMEKREELKETNRSLLALARRVQIGAIRVAPPTRSLSLPASLQPNSQADLFAQAVGYIRERHVDIGDHVKAGDVLAVIDIPLVEEELNRSRAALAEAEAARAEVEKNRSLARTTLDRWQAVEPPGAVSRQEIDERTSAFEAAEAAFNAADAVVATRRADVQRFERQQAFSRVVAPFDGVITARNIEVGDYIGSAGPAGAPMFSIADTQTLRVYVDVPQAFARGIAIGQPATVSIRELGERTLSGTVARTSGALNEHTRTLRVEVVVPNESGQVLANAYGQVLFQIPQPSGPVIVPGAALSIRAEGPRVAIVDGENKLRYLPVTVGRDLGTEVEITRGLVGNERIVVNMADDLPEGSVVETVATTPNSAPNSTPAAPSPAPATTPPVPSAAPAAKAATTGPASSAAPVPSPAPVK